jgi:tricorn protease
MWMSRRFLPVVAVLLGLAILAPPEAAAQDSRLLRQPAISAEHIAFAYGGDLWIVDRSGGEARRLTATPAVVSGPHFSPDGQRIAYTSAETGPSQVHVIGVEGGNPTRLTWYPNPSQARGWTPDGARILYATGRETAPTNHARLWTVPAEGGPSTLLPAPFGFQGTFSPDGAHLAIEPTSKWDPEWRGYRGGQNLPLVLLDLESLDEVLLPGDRYADTHPVWIDGTVYFLSDRDWAANVWAYDVASGDVEQITFETEVDIKHLSGGAGMLVYEHDGWIHTLDPQSRASERVNITVRGDFPWARPRWVDVSTNVSAAGLSATGQRAVMEARGEIFTVPVEHGTARNLTRTDGAADRAPVWSPLGDSVAWFSDRGEGYRLLIGPQDGLGEPRSIEIGESKMAWNPSWSPDGSRIAFMDDRARVQVVEVASGRLTTADLGGDSNDRTSTRPVWSPDSRWLAYENRFPNRFRRLVVWSVETGETHVLTDPMADAFSPAWDRDGRHLWFLAGTDLGLSSGWANTSSILANPSYGAYVMILRSDDPTPFPTRSDEEKGSATGSAADTASGDAGRSAAGSGAASGGAAGARSGSASADPPEVRIDLEGIERRIVPLPMPVRRYGTALAGPRGTVFLTEMQQGQPGMTLHAFRIESREAQVFTQGVGRVAISGDGSRILFQSGGQWRVVDTARPPDATSGRLTVNLQARIDPEVEWRQIFDETWRMKRDFFYDPNTHGADWDAVYARYFPLLEHVRHRADLNYVIGQMGSELTVGHSYFGGGDMPPVQSTPVGVLGADLEAADGRWRIARIFTTEQWNPGLAAPLDQPGMQVREGDYLLAVEGVELTASEDPYRAFEGTVGRQLRIHVSRTPSMEDAWTEVLVPIANEGQLRQRAWVEDNRRRVDELSGGRLAYVWVPNTGNPGLVSFDRYYFSQQDRSAAVIDERFNGGGLLDDYMVDLMNRSLRAGITNEAVNGAPFQLPAGILGPKVLLINQYAGSGGDFFPWVFRHLDIGPLIGMRTWGGLVRSCGHFPRVDGGSANSPCNAVFEPGVDWIAENYGIPADIEVRVTARDVAEGRDPQLERGVTEALRLLELHGEVEVVQPPFPVRSRRPGDGGR